MKLEDVKIGEKYKLDTVDTVVTANGVSYENNLVYFKNNKGAGGFVGASRLSPIEKTMDNLEVGDVLVNGDGDAVMILGICGKIYL